MPAVFQRRELDADVPEVSQLMSRIQWGREVLQGVHVIWPSHLLHQKLHLNLKRETEGDVMS